MLIHTTCTRGRNVPSAYWLREPDPTARGLRICVGFDGNFHDFPVVDPDPRFSRLGKAGASGDDVWEGSGVHGLDEVFERAEIVRVIWRAPVFFTCEFSFSKSWRAGICKNLYSSFSCQERVERFLNEKVYSGHTEDDRLIFSSKS